MIEIERKFLVENTSFKKVSEISFRIKQGYLNSHPERTTRIRIRDDQAFITIKGKSSADGLSRFEWEKEINVSDAEALLELCEPGIIDKIRYLVRVGEHTYEVDEFFGDNEGLLMAEVELASGKEEIIKPEWLGLEVTGDKKYYNSQLSRNPYKLW